MSCRRTLAFGHRGALALAPENTLAGFKLALDLGADGVEFDIHLSRDGQVVVHHDPTVDRTTNGSGAIAEMTLAELKKLDAGASRPDCTGPERIPTLTETLQLIRGRGRAQIELKEESPEALMPALEIIRSLGQEKDCALLSFRPRLIALARQQAPEIERDLIVIRPFRQVEAALDAGVTVLNLPTPFVTARVVNRAHAAGMEVGAGIVNHEPTMRRLIEAGVDRLYSDRPDVLVRVVRQMAAWSLASGQDRGI